MAAALKVGDKAVAQLLNDYLAPYLVEAEIIEVWPVDRAPTHYRLKSAVEGPNPDVVLASDIWPATTQGRIDARAETYKRLESLARSWEERVREMRTHAATLRRQSLELAVQRHKA